MDNVTTNNRAAQMADDKLLTTSELARAWQVSTAQVRKMRRDGLPCVTLGPRLFRFDLEACENYRRVRGGI